ncbi:MAG: hypothetical protein HUK40_17235 [Desulfobacter sp.]|nr:hypothetical protein [Desulfobacter sp.]
MASVSALCERGDRQGITALMLKDQQEMMAQALENCSTEDLARFGRALKSRRVQAAGTRLVEYEITNGEHTHAVSFINMDGEWYLYHF